MTDEHSESSPENETGAEESGAEQTQSNLEMSTTIDIELATERRLRRRGRHYGHESYDQVINSLLIETTKTIPLREAIDIALDEFDDVACVVVNHLNFGADGVGNLCITIYTGDAGGFEEYLNLFGPEYRITFDNDESAPKRQYDFSFMATMFGPKSVNSAEGTTIYMAEDVLGAESLPLETGIEYLSDKLLNHSDWEQPSDPLSLQSIIESTENRSFREQSSN